MDCDDYARAYGDSALRNMLDSAAPFVDPALARLCQMIDPADWEEQDTPERKWMLHEWMPMGQCTYLTGMGATGKSLMAQQLATCVALGLPFLGVRTMEAPSLYITCEDDADELHRRQKAICEALGVPLSATRDKLKLVSWAGEIGTELATFQQPERSEFGNSDPIIRPTKRFRAIEQMASANVIGFIALDNVAHLFAGNENIRNEVAAFISLMNRLAMRISGSVLLLGHPNKGGAEFSGSTAWENQVRARLYLSGDDQGEGMPVDPDARVLTNSKPNYARRGDALRFRWHRWAFITEGDLPDDQRAELQAVTQASHENEAFMRCLAVATTNRRAVSHNPGVNYAPAVFAKMPEAKGTNRYGFERAFERLLHIGAIELDRQLWQGPNRHWKMGIRAAEKCANPPAPTPCADPRQPPGQVVDNASATARAPTPLYTTYNGRGLEGPAPDPDDVQWDHEEDGE